jgi:hypothetical protein
VDNRGLIFIPDISGFTRFVNETEIDHSRLIIQELLEILINANQIGLEISEIEGDAILFYKFGESPGLQELYKQVAKMFCEFHRHLVVYDNRKFCQCKACISAADLTLKVVTHYGEFTGYNVRNFNKLIGKDVIVAHQLLKNNIEQHEYWLVTNDALHDHSPANLAKWMKWDISTKETERGEIPFHYTQLGELKNEISPDTFPPLEIPNKIKLFTLSKEFETDYITLFHGVGDFNYRSRWREGVKAVKEISHFLPRVGTRCSCEMENGETILYASSYSYSPGRIEFSETDEKKNSSCYFTLEDLGDHKSRLTIDFYLKKNFMKQILFKFGKKQQLEQSFQRSLQNLEELVKEIKLPELEVL